MSAAVRSDMVEIKDSCLLYVKRPQGSSQTDIKDYASKILACKVPGVQTFAKFIGGGQRCVEKRALLWSLHLRSPRIYILDEGPQEGVRLI